MKKKLLGGITAIIIGTMLVGCGLGSNTSVGGSSSADGNAEKLKVTVSMYPLKEYTEAIAGDKAEVTCMVPDNVEPHDYDPKAK